MMLRPAPVICCHIAAILAAHWVHFLTPYKWWMRPVVFENVRKVFACRLGRINYQIVIHV